MRPKETEYYKKRNKLQIAKNISFGFSFIKHLGIYTLIKQQGRLGNEIS